MSGGEASLEGVNGQGQVALGESSWSRAAREPDAALPTTPPAGDPRGTGDRDPWATFGSGHVAMRTITERNCAIALQ